MESRSIIIIYIITFIIITTNNAYMTEEYKDKCSKGWKITGYFTPVEKDYLNTNNSNEKVIVQVSNEISESVEQRFMVKSFLDDVKIEGFGKTIQGDYIGWDFSNEVWFISQSPKGAIDNDLSKHIIAVDPTYIDLGSKVKIPTLSTPWNEVVFIAGDIGHSIKNKHIDVFTGEGKEAEFETKRITSEDNEVCIINN